MSDSALASLLLSLLLLVGFAQFLGYLFVKLRQPKVVGEIAAGILLGPALLGPRFQAAVGLSIFFLLGGAMSSIYLNIAGLFFFTSKNEWLSIATICSATIAVVLAIVLTKRFGAAGAAAAYLGAQTAQLALSWLLSTRVQPMPWHRPWLAVRALARTRTASP